MKTFHKTKAKNKLKDKCAIVSPLSPNKSCSIIMG